MPNPSQRASVRYSMAVLNFKSRQRVRTPLPDSKRSTKPCQACRNAFLVDFSICPTARIDEPSHRATRRLPPQPPSNAPFPPFVWALTCASHLRRNTYHSLRLSPYWIDSCPAENAKIG